VIRVVAGHFRNRQLKAPSGRDTRPTSARVRKALFDILGPRISGARVADCFAGTGSLGLEALSRGAATVDFFESGRAAMRALSDNIALLDVAPLTTVHSAPLPLGLGPGNPFDLVFIDPPWRQGLEGPVIERLLSLGRLAADALVIIEHDSRDASVLSLLETTSLQEHGRCVYGDTGLLMLTPDA